MRFAPFPAASVTFLVVAALTVAWPHGAAGAQSDAEAHKTAAKVKLRQGSDALNRGAYDRALAAFLEAYDLFPSPKIFFNIGLAHTRLHNDAEALRAFDRFVSSHEGDSTTVAQAESLAATLRAHVMTIDLVGAQKGTEIVVDDLLVGTVPLGTAVYLAPGTHRLVVRPPGDAAEVRRQIDATPGARLTVTVAASPPDTVSHIGEGVHEKAAASREAGPSAPAAVPPPAARPRLAGGSSEVRGTTLTQVPLPAVPSGGDGPTKEKHWPWWIWPVATGVVAAAGIGVTLALTRSPEYPTAMWEGKYPR